MYVCRYMMKSEKTTGELLKRVAKEHKNEQISRQLKQIGHTFVGTRVQGTEESAMSLINPLNKKKGGIYNMNSNMKGKQVSLPKKKREILDQMENEKMTYITSIHDRYAARPRCLENMCLVTFAVNCESSLVKFAWNGNNVTTNSECSDSERKNECTTPQKNQLITLKNGFGKMRKRRREAVLWVKMYKLATESEKYYHCKLILVFTMMFWNRAVGKLSNVPASL